MKMLLLFSILSIILFSFITITNQKDIVKYYTLKEGDKQYKFDKLEKDDIVELRLEGNPTTGFSWYIEKKANEFVIVSPQNTHNINGDNTLTGQYFSRRTKDGMVGHGGVYSFKFKVVGEGSEDILIVYKRIWDNNAPTSTVSINFATNSINENI